MPGVLINLLVQIVAGAIGGNIAGAVKDLSIGTLGNTIAGAVGGGIDGQILTAVLPMLSQSAGTLDIGALVTKRRAAFVACGDKSERDRVRDNFLKKKLDLTQTDAERDKAIMSVCEKMKSVRDKPRVTFYYLLAEQYGKLSLFG